MIFKRAGKTGEFLLYFFGSQVIDMRKDIRMTRRYHVEREPITIQPPLPVIDVFGHPEILIERLFSFKARPATFYQRVVHMILQIALLERKEVANIDQAAFHIPDQPLDKRIRLYHILFDMAKAIT